LRHVNYILKPTTIDNAKPKDKRHDLTDGGGLVLEVMPSGSKTWRFKYHLNGKREKVTIGAYPAFPIKQARDRHEELRALVERGQSPAQAKRVQSIEQKAADARRLSFRNFAQRWVDETLFYRSGGYRAQTVRWLDVYVYPSIGDMQLDEVQPGDVLAIVKARSDTAVTAERIRVIEQQICNHAIRNLLVTTNPTQPLRGAIARAPVEHHRHLSEKELGAFWRKLDEQGAHTLRPKAGRSYRLCMPDRVATTHVLMANVQRSNVPAAPSARMPYAKGASISALTNSNRPTAATPARWTLPRPPADTWCTISMAIDGRFLGAAAMWPRQVLMALGAFAGCGRGGSDGTEPVARGNEVVRLAVRRRSERP
jgi:hypothetical protein